MNLFTQKNLGKIKKSSVVTIGTFDGIHIGHQKILQKVKSIAKEKNLLSTVICFEPHPQEFFQKNNKSRITQFRDKILLLKELEINQVIVLKFNYSFSKITAENFIKDFLISKIKTKHLIIGDDFHFGSDRKGDFNLLKKFGDEYNFNVEKTISYCFLNQRISSSRIRDLLLDYNLQAVKILLNKNYSISGRIKYGNKLGRTIGFPTINLSVPQNIILSGVFLVKVFELYNNKFLAFGICNIGIRPTICGKKKLLEVHLFDFSKNIYGQYVKVEFLKFIRAEKKFNSFIELKNQIENDKVLAYKLLKDKNKIDNKNKVLL